VRLVPIGLAIALLGAAAWGYWSQPALTDYGAIAWHQRLLQPIATNIPLRSMSASQVNVSPDGEKALIVGNGTLYESADRGVRWRRLASVSRDVFLSDVAASADGRRIIASDPKGVVIQSRDGGQSWSTTPANVRPLWRVAVSTDGMRGLITAGEANNKAILRTSDGGETWTRVAGPKGSFELALSVDGRRAVVLTEDTKDTALAHTSDGGATWTEQAIAGIRLWSVALSADGLHGIAVGAQGVVMRTADGGATWSRQQLDPDLSLRHVAVSADGRRAAVVARSGKDLQLLQLTEDGGATWRAASLPFTVWPLVDHIALSADGMTGLLVGTGGAMAAWRSADGGRTWQPPNAPGRAEAWWIYGAVAFAIAMLGVALWPRRQR